MLCLKNRNLSNMREIEVKILEVDVERLEARLLELGAEKVFDGELDVIFYDFEDEWLAKREQRLRLRKVGDKTEFTFKQKVSRKASKIEDEYQVNVSNFEEMRSILEFMGMRQTRRYKKNRISYVLGNTRFEFDTLMLGVPTFLEIEAESEAVLFEWIEKLGFEKSAALPWSGSDVLRHYGIVPA